MEDRILGNLVSIQNPEGAEQLRSMNILRAGPMLTVQDRGRTGYMKYGIGESGVMDHKSYEQANRLVGNKDNEAVLEATLMGPKIQFESDCLIAVTGADMDAAIESAPIERGRAVKVSAGQTLMMGFAKTGCRAYIAVSGGIDVPVVMGSRSTNIKCHIGGYEGRALKDGDVLPIGNENYIAGEEEKLLAQHEPPEDHPEEIQVRVILGPQDNRFTGNGIVSFLTETYTVSLQSDRMGIRLDGQKIESENGTDIISDGIVFGSIQITSDGNPKLGKGQSNTYYRFLCGRFCRNRWPGRNTGTGKSNGKAGIYSGNSYR